ncbi:flagellar hook assembly protein FlgD [Salipiger mucosus]|uniref:Basal-body rod modification protein FlgD n=1 Tax=Salipiger mucosus DSM 16094 TaxID=1123237 RepID=S9Q9K9_9RHOB|nr:flagellar hook capping FlgD N-terminal domain-containing protein [Salipiger mucosus]EPX78046.1 Flagellar basal-body rod modification protein FlgD [Salipiger mucosus DSM 16094]
MDAITQNTSGQPAQATTKSEQAANKLDADFENFLSLLTAQLQNQDPLEPTDSTKFVQQLAQLSQVEQSVQTNSNLENILSKLSASTSLSDVSLIDKSVEIRGDRFRVEDGNAEEAQFSLTGAADDNVEVHVTDAEGNRVRTLNMGNVTPGTETSISWDGKNDNGNTVADGTYSFSVNATDANDEKVSYDTYVTSKVNEVTFVDGMSKLRLANGEEVPSSAIWSVS